MFDVCASKHLRPHLCTVLYVDGDLVGLDLSNHIILPDCLSCNRMHIWEMRGFASGPHAYVEGGDRERTVGITCWQCVQPVDRGGTVPLCPLSSWNPGKVCQPGRYRMLMKVTGSSLGRAMCMCGQTALQQAPKEEDACTHKVWTEHRAWRMSFARAGTNRACCKQCIRLVAAVVQHTKATASQRSSH